MRFERAEEIRHVFSGMASLRLRVYSSLAGSQLNQVSEGAYSHHIPLVKLKCLSEKRRSELAARLGVTIW